MYTNTNNTERDTIFCEHCGCIIENEDDIVVVEGRTFCRECVDIMVDEGELSKCDECGKLSFDDLTEVYGNWRHPSIHVCDDCLSDLVERGDAFLCDDCEEYFQSRWNDSSVTHYGTTVCEDCRCDHWYYCEGCGELFAEDDVIWNEDDDCYYCESCAERHRSYIHEYSYKPSPVFHGVPGYRSPVFGDPLTIGVELEVDEGGSERDCADEIMAHFNEGQLYLKHDSSVEFEIVTHPHTLAAYRTEFNWDRLCQIARDYDFESHTCGTCGLHMHVGRAQLGATREEQRDVIARIVLLIQRHSDPIVKFSRRKESQLNHWAVMPDVSFRSGKSYDDAELRDAVENYYWSIGRYQALNLENRGTIEFRLWRGTLVPSTIDATLQLTHNIVRYAMTHTYEEVANSKWLDIAKYETCDTLERYLDERGLNHNDHPARTIPYGAVTPDSTSADPEFKVDDYVRITSLEGDGLVHDDMVGARGTVVNFDTSWGRDRVLIRLDRENNAEHMNRRGHNANGLSRNSDCYWVNRSELAHCDRATGAVIGDRVRILSGLREGETGILVFIDHDYDESIRYGIALDDTMLVGHDLEGHMPAFFRQDSGWFVREIEVVTSTADIDNDAVCF